MNLKTIICTILSVISIAGNSFGRQSAEEKVTINSIVEFDKTIHDFGNVMLQDGELKCTFNVTNISGNPIAILNVVTSCGCTKALWTKAPIAPGKTGIIEGRYSNDEGPYPFDKTLTVYISGIKKPVILRMRGIVHKQKQSLAELYPINIGGIGFRGNDIKCGNMTQGTSKSDKIRIANLTNKDIKIDFTNISENLKIKAVPNPIPAHSEGFLSYTVTADRKLWGKNYYYSTPVINGKLYKFPDNTSKIGIWAFTIENFGNLTKEKRDNAPVPFVKESSFIAENIKKGTIVKASFELANTGKETLEIYKIDSDSKKTSVNYERQIKPGEKSIITAFADTSEMQEGESAIVLTITTNSILKPVVYLYIYIRTN